MITKEKIWTYQDYLRLDDDKRYEVIEGELIEMPSPSDIHQIISSNLSYELVGYVRFNKMGRVLAAPLDTIFDEINTFQPDLLFISNARLNVLEKRGAFGSPDLVIEILSPATTNNDKVKKFNIYQKYKVKEYWIVDPEEHSIQVFTLEEDKLISYCNMKNKDKLNSKVFEEIDICFEDLVL